MRRAEDILRVPRSTFFRWQKQVKKVFPTHNTRQYLFAYRPDRVWVDIHPLLLVAQYEFVEKGYDPLFALRFQLRHVADRVLSLWDVPE